MSTNIDLLKLDEEQRLLQGKININETNIDSIKTIAGVDVAYFNHNNIEYGVCCIDVFDYNDLHVIEKVNYFSKVEFPYIRGYLSYRELPLVLKAYEKLKTKPDIFMMDGNGYLHQNHMGLATRFGLETNEKSIGVAKTFYNFAKTSFDLGDRLYDVSPIIINDGIYGYAMRSRLECNPIFISPGNGIGFNNSISIIKKCIGKESRVPIPTREADLDTHIESKKLLTRMR